LRDGFDEQHIGIADAHRVIKGLADNERLKAQLIMAPIGIDPINHNALPAEPAPKIRTQAPPAPTIRTQAAAPQPSRDRRESATDDREGAVPPAAPAPVPIRGATPEIPRNSPCPCHSGLKYKRCCGAAAPRV
jgi:SEC-C motif